MRAESDTMPRERKTLSQENLMEISQECPVQSHRAVETLGSKENQVQTYVEGRGEQQEGRVQEGKGQEGRSRRAGGPLLCDLGQVHSRVK